MWRPPARPVQLVIRRTKEGPPPEEASPVIILRDSGLSVQPAEQGATHNFSRPLQISNSFASPFVFTHARFYHVLPRYF